MVTAGTFDAVGSTELQNAGKAGLIQIQGKISAVLGTVLICEYSLSSVSNITFSHHISCFYVCLFEQSLPRCVSIHYILP